MLGQSSAIQKASPLPGGTSNAGDVAISISGQAGVGGVPAASINSSAALGTRNSEAPELCSSTSSAASTPRSSSSSGVLADSKDSGAVIVSQLRVQVVRALLGRDELLTDEAGKRERLLRQIVRLGRSCRLGRFGVLRRYRNIEKLEIRRRLWLRDSSVNIQPGPSGADFVSVSFGSGGVS